MDDDYEPPFDEASGPTPPNDEAAEQAYFAALLLTQPRGQRAVHQLLAGADFYRPAHTTIHTAAGRLLDQAQPVDTVTLVAELQQAGELVRVGGYAYISRLTSALPGVASSATAYADRIRALALRRALIETGSRIAARGYDPAGDPADLAEEAVALAREVRDAGRAAEDSPVLDMWDFLAIEETHDWVVPGLLERMDRAILTGGEGGGKSVLMRQLATCLAAGLHPFHHDPNPIGPAKVLVLDCENSEAQSRRAYRPLMNTAAAAHMPVKRGQLHIDCRPEGVDLTRADGRAWLMRRVETVMPDVLVIGPIYQLHSGDPASEEHARKVTLALTEARTTARCALLMEAHAPHASGYGPRALRPAGSSLWMRWPEFGYGIRPVEDERSADEDRARRLVPWRGARDERQWPEFLRQGHGHNSWPWVPYTPIDFDPISRRSPTGATS